MNELVTFFKNKKVSSVLDVGCGSGDFLKILTNVFPPKTQFTAIDPFEGPLLEARTKFPFVKFLKMEGEKMDFPDHHFDVVSISFALHHLDDVTTTLSEMKRVVKPEGWLIINEVTSDVQNQAQENHKQLHHLKSFADRLNGTTHRETYSINEVLEIVKNNQITIEHSFLNLKMGQPGFDPDFLKDKVDQMEDYLHKLKGHAQFEATKQQFAGYANKLKEHGFQIAPSIVVIGKSEI